MAQADVETEFGKTGGMHLRFTVLQHVYVELLERCQEMEDDPESTLEEMTPIREMCVRAFCLFLVCCTIFSNKSAWYVDVTYLQFFQDLTTTHEWNWGAAALAYMQQYMDDASDAETSQMAGYLSLVQVKNKLKFICVKFIHVIIIHRIYFKIVCDLRLRV
jgi:hypothetical protein